MVTRCISILLVSLTLFACGSRRKHIQQEHQRTEQTASERTEYQAAVRSEKDKRVLEVVDTQGFTTTTVYGVNGTISPDGSFTGIADSTRTIAALHERSARQSVEHETSDSVGTSIIERLDSLVHGSETNTRIQEARRSVPWWLWVCISALVVFSLWFGTPLKRIFNPFKR